MTTDIEKCTGIACKNMCLDLKYEFTLRLYNARATTHMLSLTSEKFGSDGCFLLPS